MPIRTGVERIREALAEQAARAASGRKWLLLRDDGESALIRFLSDMEDPRAPGGLAVQAKFHIERTQAQGGGIRMSDPIMCTEDETCNLCTTTGEPSRLMTLLHVWVYHIDHAEQRQQTGRFGGEPWQPVQGMDGRSLFREVIEAPRVLRATIRLTNQIMTVYGHEGSLLTKDYTLTRTGRRGTTDVNYVLYPQKEAAFERELGKLVSLVDFAEGRATLGGEEVQTHATAPAAEPKPVESGDLVEFGGDSPAEPEAADEEGEPKPDTSEDNGEDSEFALGNDEEE